MEWPQLKVFDLIMRYSSAFCDTIFTFFSAPTTDVIMTAGARLFHAYFCDDCESPANRGNKPTVCY